MLWLPFELLQGLPSFQNQEIEKDIKRQDKEEEKVQKVPLLGEMLLFEVRIWILASSLMRHKSGICYQKSFYGPHDCWS
jgi:hypothetical protein